jgi:hypothetical protein
MFKKNLESTRTSSIFLEQNRKKSANFLENLDFHTGETQPLFKKQMFLK